MTTKDTKEKAIKKGRELGLHLGYANKLEEYTDFVIDLAIAEERNRASKAIVERADSETDYKRKSGLYEAHDIVIGIE